MNAPSPEPWPPLPYEAWKDTCETLHMWTQIVGKVKLELAPFLNEWWEVAFFVSARGLTTGTIPYRDGVFQVDFDFIGHELSIATSEGGKKTMPLTPRSVADFYIEFMAALRELSIEVAISTLPTEVPDPIPFEEDRVHASYDPVYAHRWWRVMMLTGRVMQRYRSSFVGKSSPVQFYWGSFDLNASRFSGRPAPPMESGPIFFRISEDQENIACGFWPGNPSVAPVQLGEPAFYSYILPAPAGLERVTIQPEAAYHDASLGEFILLYEDARRAPSPEEAILAFFQSTYEAAADLAGWDRARLEHAPPRIRHLRKPRP